MLHPTRALFAIIAVLTGFFQASPSRAGELVVDLSKHLVAISTAFTGADVLLFGAVNGPGDIIVTVRGPDEDVEVYRKSRRMGIWVNGEKARFNKVPAYYATASNRPIEEFANEGLLGRHQIGVEKPNSQLPSLCLVNYPLLREFRCFFRLRTLFRQPLV